jgi:outer membrane protein assembly factor BamB
MTTTFKIFLSVAILTTTTSFLSAEDWAGFRGPSSGSVAKNSKVPVQWKENENVAWKVELPGLGPASPIVVGNQVIVTCSSGYKQKRLHVVSYDANSGEQLWHRQFWATGRTSTHPFSAVAANTPTSDGKRIFAFFSSNDLICLDLQGDLQWYRGLGLDFPKSGNDVGMSSSPLTVAGTVVVQVEAQGDSFAISLKAEDGSTLWRHQRDQRANWASPVAINRGNGKSLVLLQSPNSGLTAHDPQSGEELWKYEAVCSGVPSPLVLGDSILISSNGLTKLKFGKDSNSPELSWDAAKLRPGSASPVVYNNNIYTMNTGVLKCGDLASGDVKWQLRLHGKYWATPVIAGGKMYVVNQDGVAKVIQLGDEKGEVIGESDFGEAVKGSPAVAGDAMFVRTDEHLWKISSK